MGASCCEKSPSTNEPAVGAHDHDDNEEGQVHAHETHDHRPKTNASEDRASDTHGHSHSHDEGAEIRSLATGTTCCGTEERCDEKCIYAAAALECGKACAGDDDDPDKETHRHEHDEGGHMANTACPSHIQMAVDKYTSYLQQLRCICRDALRESSSTEICCGKKTSRKQPKTKSCCGDMGCTGKNNNQDPSKFEPSGFAHQEVDLEQTGNMETVHYLVSGMDCTSCADKLMTIFSAMPGVSSPRVNFVVGRGEVHVDTSVTSADEVLRFAATASNFSLVKVVGGDFYLDVLAGPAEARKLTEQPPQGVTDAQILDRKTVRLAYDPTVTGARDLLASLQGQCQGLAEPRGDSQLENSRRRLRDQLYKTLLAALFTIPVTVLAYANGLVDKQTKGIVSIVLGTCVQIIAIPEFYRPALSALWYSHIVEMDMLVVMSITAAYGYSVVAFGFEMGHRPLEQGDFFETSSMLITLILMGRLVAAFARVQAVAAVSLRSRLSSSALLVTSAGAQEIDARLLQYGDSFKVLPHTRVPTDGVVTLGKTEVDESMLTGESMPVLKKQGDDLIAGTLNGDGIVTARLTRLPGKNTVTDIAQLVEEAANSKPKLQDLANKVASWFVPIMAAIAVLVLVIWLAVGLRVLEYSAGRSIGTAITYTVATLAVACPCALGLAVPMVIVVAGGIAAKGGVIIKSAETTERARKITDVVFDKTGTITEDDLAVVEQVILADVQEDEAVSLTRALVAGGKHPVSAAMEKYLAAQSSVAAAVVSGIRVIPGAGIEARYQENTVKAGNAEWTGTSKVTEVARVQGSGLTTLVVTLNGTPLVVFGLRTQIRREALGVIEGLKSRNIAVHLVSGDQILAVQAVARAVGIPPENVAGHCTPPEKRDYVGALMSAPAKYVMFCGDGTNDAVAVAQADVGAQMGGGKTSSDVTQGAADVVLMKGLEGIPFLLRVSRAAYQRMVFNFVWAAVYNVLAVTMASGAWVAFRIEPQYAGAGEMVSVLPVILAAVSMFVLNLRRGEDVQ
ncbi:E1-E2 ATPase-domain-containing protein [Emericellopsis atlantica]|uniref:E1-E2 ATPase-domain-containing protein n=1 Tax=Emericellopsis atlantica TaxID=2614577 RepID=A0A9P7ZRB0_9HYPO|nr:E1-E2 ATPase-domain-containing protein [Emericellopsis atlantica]KAG9256250.1 E1-E2 ATPase-domain-containing protein [Emericellopsis atlantica]